MSEVVVELLEDADVGSEDKGVVLVVESDELLEEEGLGRGLLERVDLFVEVDVVPLDADEVGSPRVAEVVLKRVVLPSDVVLVLEGKETELLDVDVIPPEVEVAVEDDEALAEGEDVELLEEEGPRCEVLVAEGLARRVDVVLLKLDEMILTDDELLPRVDVELLEDEEVVPGSNVLPLGDELAVLEGRDVAKETEEEDGAVLESGDVVPEERENEVGSPNVPLLLTRDELVGPAVDEDDVLLLNGLVGPAVEEDVVLRLEEEVVGRGLLERVDLVVEVDVDADDVVPEEVEVDCVLESEVVLLSDVEAFDDDSTVVGREDVVVEVETGSPKVEDRVLESEAVPLSKVEVLEEDGNVLVEVVEKLDDVEVVRLEVAVELLLDEGEVKLPVVDDKLRDDTERVEEDDVLRLEEELVGPTVEEVVEATGSLQASLMICFPLRRALSKLAK